MAKFFFELYTFFHNHRLIFFVALSILLLAGIFSATQLRFKENIWEVIPNSREVNRVQEVIENSTLNTRLVFHIYSEDSLRSDPDHLITSANTLVDSLNKKYGKYLEKVIIEIPDEQISKLFDYYYTHLPFYLESTDYDSLEQRLSRTSIQGSVDRIYKQLLSPVNVVGDFMLKDPLGLTSKPLQRMRKASIQQNFDLYLNHIFTRDRRHMLFFIVLANPPNETSVNSRFIDGLEREIHGIRQHDQETHIEYFGPAAVAVANAERIKKDIYLTVTLALIALFVLISLFFRNIFTFFLALTPGLFGAIFAIAILSVLKNSVSIISLSVGSVLLGVTVDYALHIFTHFKRNRSMEDIFGDLTNPLLMSGLTTAAAFLSLLFIRSPALQDLGIFAGISIIGAVLSALIVLPHLVGSLRWEDKKRKNFVERGIDWLSSYSFHKKTWAVTGLCLISVLCLFRWNQVSFNSNMLSLNYMPSYLQKYQDGINEVSDFSTNTLYFASKGKNIPDALQKSSMLYSRLKELEQKDSVLQIQSLNSFLPSPELQEKRLELWRKFWTRQRRDSLLFNLKVAAKEKGFREGMFTKLSSVLRDSYDSIHSDAINQLIAITGADLVTHNQDGTVTLLTAAQVHQGNKTAVLNSLKSTPDILIMDRSFITNNLIQLLQNDFNKLVNISLAVVFAIILVYYGRIELALMVFVPLLVSWLWVLGIMGWLGLTFNIVNIIICTFIFGLGVDYSIFIMRGLTQGYGFGLNNLPTYKKSILISMITTLLGIGVLAWAQHPALKSIALLAIIGIFSMVFITFSLEIILFNLLIGRRKRKGVLPHTASSIILSFIAFGVYVTGCLFMYMVQLIMLLFRMKSARSKLVFHRLIRVCTHLVFDIMRNVHITIEERQRADYNKPSVIISNHHSFTDILLMLMIHPKVVMVTNDWVYHSPLFGKVVQFGDFIPASQGLENQLPKMRKLVDDGYSIFVFPEGTRSTTSNIGRFHKGAFYLSEKLGLDIQPVILHGTHHIMPSGDDFYLRTGKVTIHYLPRIDCGDMSFGLGYRERTKNISRYFKKNYLAIKERNETPYFFKQQLIRNYIYKSPILEWYIRIKLRLEKYYSPFHSLIPQEADILDLGCGYGLMSYALGWSAGSRKITGIDYDENKIRIAQNCPVQPSNVRFVHKDLMSSELDSVDVYLISDVLHYLELKEQNEFLKKIVGLLKPAGKIIIRDGDTQKTKHRNTQLTEFFSVGLGFNKVRNRLNFISSEFISTFAESNNLMLEVITDSNRTSNTIFVLTRNGN